MAVRAQQFGDVRRVAILLALPKDHPGSRLGLKAFRAGMEKLGWIEGKNVRYEIRSAGKGSHIRELAKEVVRQTPDVIFVIGTPLTEALHRETKNLPIVFAMTSDPVGDGVVESLAHPGGHITGFTALYPEIVGKWVQILKEVAPGTKRAAMLFNPRTAPFVDSGVLRRLFETAARQIEVEPIMAPVHDAREIKAAIKSLAQTQGGGVVVMADASMLRNFALIIETVALHVTICLRSILMASMLCAVGLSPTGRMYSTSIAALRITSIAFLRAQSRESFPYKRRLNSS
jgi:putative ABC transport system substrate-binding protein